MSSSLSRSLNFQYTLEKNLLEMARRAPKRLPSGVLSPSPLASFMPNRDEMRRVFDKMDRDGDGKVSVKDLGGLLAALETGTDADAEEMVGVADADGDGKMDFNDFMEVHRKGVLFGEIKRAFRVFDSDEDGRVQADDVMRVLRALEEPCTVRECTRMVRQVGRAGDGFVSVEDFMDMMTRTMKPV